MPVLQMRKAKPGKVTLPANKGHWTQSLLPKSILFSELLSTNQSIKKPSVSEHISQLATSRSLHSSLPGPAAIVVSLNCLSEVAPLWLPLCHVSLYCPSSKKSPSNLLTLKPGHSPTYRPDGFPSQGPKWAGLCLAQGLSHMGFILKWE